MKEKIKMIGSIIILLFVMILSIILFALAAKKNERIVDDREKETINIITTMAVPQVSSVITEEITENLIETIYNSTTTTTTTPTITTTTEKTYILSENNSEISENNFETEIIYDEPNIEESNINDETIINNEEIRIDNVFIKTFSRGTYYTGSSTTIGGSQRKLLDCSTGDGQKIKGSIASRYLYNLYGYKNRPYFYLESKKCPDINGFYTLDDCSASGTNNVIDFFYTSSNNCPFKKAGVIDVDCYFSGYYEN